MCPTFLDYFRVALSVTVNSVICAIFFRFTGTFQTAQWRDIVAMVALFTACRSVVTSNLLPDHISDNALRRYGHNTDQETEHRLACTTHTPTPAAAALMKEPKSPTESAPAMKAVENAHLTDVSYMCNDASLQTEPFETVEETDTAACATASSLWSLPTENDPSKVVGVGDGFQHLWESSTTAIANGLAVADDADSTNEQHKSRLARSLRDDGIISNEAFIGAPLPTETFERENTNGTATALAATTGTPSQSPLLLSWTKNGASVAVDDVVKSTTQHIKSFLFGPLPSHPTPLTDSLWLPNNAANDEVMELACSPPSPSPSLASTDNDDSQTTDCTVTTLATAADDATTAQPHLLQPKKKVGQRQRQRRNKAIAKAAAAAAAAATAAIPQARVKGNVQKGKMPATGIATDSTSKVGRMTGSKGQTFHPNPWQRRQSRREEAKQLNEAAALEAAEDAEMYGIQARQEQSETICTFLCENVRGVATGKIVDATATSLLNNDEKDMVHYASDDTPVSKQINSIDQFPTEHSRKDQAVSLDNDCIAAMGEKLDATATLSLDVSDFEETVNTVPMPIHVGKKVRKPRPGKRQRAHRKALLLAALHDQNDPLSMVRTALSLDDPWHYESAAADDELSVAFQEAESRVAKELLDFLDDQ